MAERRGPHRTREPQPARRRSAAVPSADGVGPLPTLRILETRVLRGPNYWAREPVIRLLVDLGVLEDYPTDKIPNFTDALVALLPTLEDHACSLGRRGGFITRLREGTWVGHVAEHIALEFQNLAGHRRPARQDPLRRAARPVQLHLRVPRGAGRARGRSDGRGPGQLPRRARTIPSTSSTSPRSSSGSSGSPSARRSGRRPRPSSTRRSAATSRSSAWTAIRSSSSVTASTSSGSGRR